MSWGVALRNAVGLGLGGIPSLLNAPPYASLKLNFTEVNALDPRITFTRASGATYFNSAGILSTAANNEARFDYDPVTLAARGLLIEEQRTNSIRNNTMQGAVAGTPGTLPTNWTVTSGSGNGITRTIVGVGTESGIEYIDIQYAGTAIASGNLSITSALNNQIAAAQNQVWTFSFYAKLVAGSFANTTARTLYLNSYTATGGFDANATAISTNFPAGGPTNAALNTQRYFNTGTLSSAITTFVNAGFFLTYSAGAAVDFTLRIGLPQLELGAFATSVIPTTTTALTRAADVATMTGANFSGWYNQTEGTLLTTTLAFNQTFAPNRFISTIDDGTTSNIIGAYIATDLNATTFVVNGGVAQYQEVISTVSNTSANKISVTYKANNFTSACNGVIGPVDTSGNVPVVNKITFGNRTDGARPLNGWVRAFSYYPKQLSAGQLQALTK
jgi:hypothetical protein